MRYQFGPTKGFQDRFGDAKKRYDYIVKKFNETASLYNCESIETPIIEKKSLFNKAAGEETDISKEMFEFIDKDGQEMVIRPEITSPICRFLIHNNITKARLSYVSGVCRRERPQLGRRRGFTQCGIEFIGGENTNIEVIFSAINFFQSIGIMDKLTIVINNIGNEKTSKEYSKIFIDYLKKQNLSDLSQKRMEKNPLRIWDSKEEEDREVLKKAPTINDCLTETEKKETKQLINIIESKGVIVKYDLSLMRGLDYYNGIVFEFLNQEGLAVLGGGRYDELLSKMSSGDVSAPCTGWALGIERIEGMIQLPEDNRPIIFVCPIDESDVIESLVLADKIRCLGYGVDFYEEKNITKRLQKINSLKTNSYVIILGESERFSKKAKIKRMKDGEEKEIDLQNICFDQGFI